MFELLVWNETGEGGCQEEYHGRDEIHRAGGGDEILPGQMAQVPQRCARICHGRRGDMTSYLPELENRR